MLAAGVRDVGWVDAASPTTDRRQNRRQDGGLALLDPPFQPPVPLFPSMPHRVVLVQLPVPPPGPGTVEGNVPLIEGTKIANWRGSDGRLKSRISNLRF